MNLSDAGKEPKAISAVGIIAEYNPFHNGHAYQIHKAKQLSGADYCIVVMSGDFVQRGAPAVFDKYTRTQAALLGGADLVLELPPAFAVSSAEDFASCAVSLLDRLTVVSHLCFGSECGEIKPLMDTARLLCREPGEFRTVLKEELKHGLTFPQARIKALNCVSRSVPDKSRPADFLSSPNNILGVEYCKALIRGRSSMTPVTLSRLGSGYHDTEPSSSREASVPGLKGLFPSGKACFSSASALRKLLESPYLSPDHEKTLLQNIPAPVWELFKSRSPVFCDDFSPLLTYRLLELQSQNADLAAFGDVSGELAARIRHRIPDFSSFERQIEALKTRQYTYTRISRSLIHLLLHITKEDISCRKGHGYVSYFRVLGFRKDSACLLKAIKKAARLPLITKTADAANYLSDETLQEFRRDLFCSHIYRSVAGQKKGNRNTSEYTQPLIIL